MGGEHPRAGAGAARHAEQHLRRADLRTADRARLVLRPLDRLARSSREPLEHHRSLRASSLRPPPCFLWTACLLTPSASAICCQDHPRVRALSTCSASSDSSSARSDATAASPTAGSLLAVASARSVACVMGVNLH